MLFFVRFFLAFLLTLGVVLGLIYYFKPTLAMMKSPQNEKAVLESVYKLQDSGAEKRLASQAMVNVASYCLFYGTDGKPMPVTPVQQELTDFYAKAGSIKARTTIMSVKFKDNKAEIVARSVVDWKGKAKNASGHEQRTTTKDIWEKLVGRWSCNSVKVLKSSPRHFNFVVPH